MALESQNPRATPLRIAQGFQMVAAALPAVLNITGVAAAFALLYAFRSVL